MYVGAVHLGVDYRTTNRPCQERNKCALTIDPFLREVRP